MDARRQIAHILVACSRGEAGTAAEPGAGTVVGIFVASLAAAIIAGSIADSQVKPVIFDFTGLNDPSYIVPQGPSYSDPYGWQKTMGVA